MQKTNKNASILIWTIFLSIVVSMAFLWISTKIHQNIKNSGEFIQQIENQVHIDTYIKEISISWNRDNKNFWDNITLEFENSDTVYRSFKTGEFLEFRFFQTGSTNTQIEVISGWPIYLSGGTFNWILSGSGIISFDVISPNYKSIQMKNLWANTNIKLESNKIILPAESKYNIFRKIWNLKNIQSSWKINNFTPWAF